LIFPSIISTKKTDCPSLQKGVKRTRKAVNLETNMLVIRKMETGEKRASICRSLGLAPVIVSTVMTNGEKINQSAQKTTELRASNVSYTKQFSIKK
jgi:hypothetical protein